MLVKNTRHGERSDIDVNYCIKSLAYFSRKYHLRELKNVLEFFFFPSFSFFLNFIKRRAEN